MSVVVDVITTQAAVQLLARHKTIDKLTRTVFSNVYNVIKKSNFSQQKFKLKITRRYKYELTPEYMQQLSDSTITQVYDNKQLIVFIDATTQPLGYDEVNIDVFIPENYKRKLRLLNKSIEYVLQYNKIPDHWRARFYICAVLMVAWLISYIYFLIGR